MTTISSTKVPLLELRDIGKSFGRVQALRGVNFTLQRAEVLGLLGDNGAGKSTLIKILAGVHRPDAGQILWNSQPVELRKPQDAIALGVSVAYQDLAIVNTMSVWRNLFLGREHAIARTGGALRGPLRILQARQAQEDAKKALAELGVRIADVTADVLTLSGGERQSIAIARAVFFESKLLILDEPTSALSVGETEKVLGYVRRARDLGISVIVITHNILQAIAVSDSFLVLHLGTVALRCGKGDVSIQELNNLVTFGNAEPV